MKRVDFTHIFFWKIYLFITYYQLRLLADNDIQVIKSDGSIGRLPHLHKLDFQRNVITKIEENAFEGATKLHELYVRPTSC